MLSADPTGRIVTQIQSALESSHKVWLVGELPVPAAGASFVSLPPPPLPISGWSADPYLQLWSLETGAFLQQHVLEAHEVPVDFPGGPFEAPRLFVIRGWRP